MARGQFVAVYPHPIGIQTNNVTCSYSNVASAATWKSKISSGEMLASAEEFLWINHIGDRSAGEQPPSAFEFLIGPPSFTVNALDHFATRDKTWCWWTRGLPKVPLGRRTPDHKQLPRRSGSSPERRMLVRTETELQFARDHVATWNLTPWQNNTPRPADVTTKGFKQDTRALKHNFSLFASHYAPIQ